MVGVTGGSFIWGGSGGGSGVAGGVGGGAIGPVANQGLAQGVGGASKMSGVGGVGGAVKQSLTSRTREARSGRSRNGPRGPGAVLEKVLGITTEKNTSLALEQSSGTVAYLAGGVVVTIPIGKRHKQSHVINAAKKSFTCVAFSPDGRLLVTGEKGHQPAVRVWDAVTTTGQRQQIAEFVDHSFGIQCVAFAGQDIVISIGFHHDMMINVWDLKAKKKLASNKISTKVEGLAVSPLGPQISFVTAGNRHVRFWYLKSADGRSLPSEPRPLVGRAAILGERSSDNFVDVAFGRNQFATSVFVVSESGLVCELNEERKIAKWINTKTQLYSICVSSSVIFVGCASGVIRAFDAASLEYLATLPRPHPLGVDVAKFPQALAYGGQMSVSSIYGDFELNRYPDCIATVFDVERQKITAIYNDHSLYVWDVQNVRRVGKNASFLFHSSKINGLEVVSPHPLHQSTPHQLDPYYLPQDGIIRTVAPLTAALPMSSFLTCSEDGTIRVWNLDASSRSKSTSELPAADVLNGALTTPIAGGSNALYPRNILCHDLLKILYSDDKLTSLCGDENAADPAGNKKMKIAGISALRMSPCGQFLTSGDNQGNVRIYDIVLGGEVVRSIEAHDSQVLSLDFSGSRPGPRLFASASRDRIIHVFDVENDFELVTSISEHSSSITSVKFATDPQHRNLHLLSAGMDKSIVFRRFDPTAARQDCFVTDHFVSEKSSFYAMEADLPNSRVIAACSDRKIRIYDVVSGKETKAIKGTEEEDGSLVCAVMDVTSRFIATSCSDKTIAIVDLSTGNIVANMAGHSEKIIAVKFLPHGRHLISVSADSCVFVWRLSSFIRDAIDRRSKEMGIATAPRPIRIPASDFPIEITGVPQVTPGVQVAPGVPQATPSSLAQSLQNANVPDLVPSNHPSHLPGGENLFYSPAKQSVAPDLLQEQQPQRYSAPVASLPSPVPHQPPAASSSGKGSSSSSSHNRFSISALPTWAKKVWKTESPRSRGSSSPSEEVKAEKGSSKSDSVSDDNASVSDSASGSTRSFDAGRSSRSTWGKSAKVDFATAPTSPANSSGGTIVIEDERLEEEENDPPHAMDQSADSLENVNGTQCESALECETEKTIDTSTEVLEDDDDDEEEEEDDGGPEDVVYIEEEGDVSPTLDPRATFEVHTPLPASARARSRLQPGNNGASLSIDGAGLPQPFNDDDDEEESFSEPTTPVGDGKRPSRSVARGDTFEASMDLEEEDGCGFVHAPDYFENNLISPESPAYDARCPFGLAEHRLSLSAKFNMRQRPHFGAAAGAMTDFPSSAANAAVFNTRLNLESKFDGAGEKDEEGGVGGGGRGGESGNGGGSLSARGGGRKAGVKPPSSLSVDISKSGTPRGDSPPIRLRKSVGSPPPTSADAQSPSPPSSSSIQRHHHSSPASPRRRPSPRLSSTAVNRPWRSSVPDVESASTASGSETEASSSARPERSSSFSRSKTVGDSTAVPDAAAASAAGSPSTAATSSSSSQRRSLTRNEASSTLPRRYERRLPTAPSANQQHGVATAEAPVCGTTTTTTTTTATSSTRPSLGANRKSTTSLLTSNTASYARSTESRLAKQRANLGKSSSTLGINRVGVDHIAGGDGGGHSADVAAVTSAGASSSSRLSHASPRTSSVQSLDKSHDDIVLSPQQQPATSATGVGVGGIRSKRKSGRSHRRDSDVSASSGDVRKAVSEWNLSSATQSQEDDSQEESDKDRWKRTRNSSLTGCPAASSSSLEPNSSVSRSSALAAAVGDPVAAAADPSIASSASHHASRQENNVSTISINSSYSEPPIEAASGVASPLPTPRLQQYEQLSDEEKIAMAAASSAAISVAAAAAAASSTAHYPLAMDISTPDSPRLSTNAALPFNLGVSSTAAGVVVSHQASIGAGSTESNSPFPRRRMPPTPEENAGAVATAPPASFCLSGAAFCQAAIPQSPDVLVPPTSRRSGWGNPASSSGLTLAREPSTTTSPLSAPQSIATTSVAEAQREEREEEARGRQRDAMMPQRTQPLAYPESVAPPSAVSASVTSSTAPSSTFASPSPFVSKSVGAAASGPSWANARRPPVVHLAEEIGNDIRPSLSPTPSSNQTGAASSSATPTISRPSGHHLAGPHSNRRPSPLHRITLPGGFNLLPQKVPELSVISSSASPSASSSSAVPNGHFPLPSHSHAQLHEMRARSTSSPPRISSPMSPSADSAPPLPRTPPPSVTVYGDACIENGDAANSRVDHEAVVADDDADADAAGGEEVLRNLERSVDALLLAQNSLPRSSSAHAAFNACARRQVVRLLRAFPEANADAFLSFLNASQLEEITKLVRRKGDF